MWQCFFMLEDKFNPHFSSEPAVLLLAAGRGERFGSDKRQHKLKSGLSLLEQSLRCFDDAGYPLKVALSASVRDDQLAAVLEMQGRSIIRCRNADEGMSGTIRNAITHFENFPGLFVALADMPLLDPQVLKLLCARGMEDRIVFPRYDSQRGHPVLFGSAFFGALGRLRGASGAASVLHENPEHCIAVDVADAGVLVDVDTPKQAVEVDAKLMGRKPRP